MGRRFWFGFGQFSPWNHATTTINALDGILVEGASLSVHLACFPRFHDVGKLVVKASNLKGSLNPFGAGGKVRLGLRKDLQPIPFLDDEEMMVLASSSILVAGGCLVAGLFSEIMASSYGFRGCMEKVVMGEIL